ncbi:Pyruvate kinase [Lignipirellula cremea]|uniref:Pyruvate kinase n=1 Tax=Lignipirellula cremea TaxID=2528010 RepID=A0A518DPS3_9BACT|nr:Pyruvate kinase [Lignipirellula cremea]
MPPLVDELQRGDRVLLSDGAVGMRVVEKRPDAAVCQVDGAGTIRTRQGINLPGVKLSTPAMSEEDLAHALWAAQAGVDFVSLSFVRTPEEIEQLKALLLDEGSSALAIAKIEKAEAVENLEAIVRASGGVMVARGDLGVEIDVAEMPVVQKRIIQMCQKYIRPVIVATQMLESMQHSKRPTRAEATDVANAVYDGADACMLSGETAVGEYPCEVVDMMRRIIYSTEKALRHAPPQASSAPDAAGVHPITAAVVDGAVRIARQADARMLVVATVSGATARVISKQRAYFPSIGISTSDATLQRMSLYWGIIPCAMWSLATARKCGSTSTAGPRKPVMSGRAIASSLSLAANWSPAPIMWSSSTRRTKRRLPEGRPHCYGLGSTQPADHRL